MTGPGVDDDLGHQGRRLAAIVAVVFGGFMHLVVGVFVLSSGLVAPGWAVLALAVLWVAAAWLVWRLRHLPILALLVPVAMAAVWWATITAGERWLGWTA